MIRSAEFNPRLSFRRSLKHEEVPAALESLGAAAAAITGEDKQEVPVMVAPQANMRANGFSSHGFR